jgi:hypothetical protein
MSGAQRQTACFSVHAPVTMHADAPRARATTAAYDTAPPYHVCGGWHVCGPAAGAKACTHPTTWTRIHLRLRSAHAHRGRRALHLVHCDAAHDQHIRPVCGQQAAANVAHASPIAARGCPCCASAAAAGLACFVKAAWCLPTCAQPHLCSSSTSHSAYTTHTPCNSRRATPARRPPLMGAGSAPCMVGLRISGHHPDTAVSGRVLVLRAKLIYARSGGQRRGCHTPINAVTCHTTRPHDCE